MSERLNLVVGRKRKRNKRKEVREHKRRRRKLVEAEVGTRGGLLMKKKERGRKEKSTEGREE